ncbi:hypothetical protein EAG_04624 [Camponotus floridanus]|uniref:Uncharacterized protein n=1 Tax=Camponotus floridanus TaxID=104421 RepID=E2A211_CAMFO|nr:hypothetical protein EAG_04624 [Camponotus floridanus]
MEERESEAGERRGKETDIKRETEDVGLGRRLAAAAAPLDVRRDNSRYDRPERRGEGEGTRRRGGRHRRKRSKACHRYRQMTLRMSPYYTRAANLSKEHLRDRSPQVAAGREGQTAVLLFLTVCSLQNYHSSQKETLQTQIRIANSNLILISTSLRAYFNDDLFTNETITVEKRRGFCAGKHKSEGSETGASYTTYTNIVKLYQIKAKLTLRQLWYQGTHHSETDKTAIKYLGHIDVTSDNEARNLRDSREDDKENTPKDRRMLVREQERARKVRKRKGKIVGDLKGVSGLTGPTGYFSTRIRLFFRSYAHYIVQGHEKSFPKDNFSFSQKPEHIVKHQQRKKCTLRSCSSSGKSSPKCLSILWDTDYFIVPECSPVSFHRYEGCFRKKESAADNGKDTRAKAHFEFTGRLASPGHGKDWTLLSRKNRLLAAEAQRLFIAHVAKKKRSREVTYCHIPRVSELKERRCLEAAKEARHFKGIPPLGARRDFSEKILPIVVEEKEETGTTMTAPSVYETKLNLKS